MTYATGFVPDRSLRLWRLPQAGFVIRSPARTVVVDPWLSDALERSTAADDHPVQRAAALPCSVADLPVIDLVCCTHEHPDHLDLETLQIVAARSPETMFVVPAPLAGIVAGAGIDAARVVGAEVEERRAVAGVDVLALPARHRLAPDAPDGYDFERDAAGHHHAVGYVLGLGGVTVFHSGDTIRFTGDADRLRREQIAVALLPVNGRDAQREARALVGNLRPSEASALAAEASIPHLVPCHYDGVVGNTGDPGAVVDHVVEHALPVTVHVVGSAGVVVTG
ncbi:MAG: MBL fold metallo-hydrolase [Gaiellaceae bacterium]